MGNIVPRVGIEPTLSWDSVLPITPPMLSDVSTVCAMICQCGCLPERSVLTTTTLMQFSRQKYGQKLIASSYTKIATLMEALLLFSYLLFPDSFWKLTSAPYFTSTSINLSTVRTQMVSVINPLPLDPSVTKITQGVRRFIYPYADIKFH